MAQTKILKNKILHLVVGDTGRQVRVWLYDPIARDASGNKQPLDLSAAGTSVVFRMTQVGGDGTILSVPCSKLAGIVDSTGEVNASAPYNVAGSGGLIQIDWTDPSVAVAGTYRGEFYITFESTKTMTLYNVMDVSIRNRL